MKLTQTIIAFALALACTTGKAQELPPKFVVDQIAAVVGGSAILYSEVDEYSHQLVQQRREKGYTSDRDPINEALEDLMLRKLLYNQALIDSVDAHVTDIDIMVEEEVQAMIKKYGSVTALEEHTKKPVYDIKDNMRQRYVEMRYAQSMQNDIESKVKITPGEVERFFRSKSRDSLPLVPEQYVYAQITKFPPSSKEAKQRVREKLLELRERIVAGTRFDALARMYSEDPGSAVRGGEMDPTPKEGFVAPFADALAKLKPGQVSEVVETEFGFHIIQLIDVNGNLYHCRHILMKPIYTNEELRNTVKQLDSLATVIRAGDITFEKAALENSDDKFSKLNGGIVSNHEMLELYNAGAKYTSTRFPKEELPVSDYKAISTMKIGDLSNAFLSQDMRGNELAKIIKLVQIIPTHEANINEDYLALENLALEDKQEKEFLKWLDKKIQAMYVRIDPAFRDGEFENKNWLR